MQQEQQDCPNVMRLGSDGRDLILEGEKTGTKLASRVLENMRHDSRRYQRNWYE